MPEVIHPSKTIRTFAFEIMHDNAFLLKGKSLREAMGIKRKSSNWLEPLNDMLNSQSGGYVAHEDNGDNVLIFKRVDIEESYQPIASSFQAGVQCVIDFITNAAQTRHSNFYISNATVRKVYNNGNITTSVTNKIDTALRTLGYRMISYDIINATRTIDRIHYVCKMESVMPFSFIDMEETIENHRVDKKIFSISPKRLSNDSMSIKNIDWGSLKQHRKNHGAINSVATFHHLSRVELNMTSENSWVIDQG